MLGSADEVLAYQTLKVVKIKDYRLGSLYYLFIFLILCWVVGYQILYCNDHFEKLDVVGTARMTIQQPTVDSCNPQHPDCKSDFRSLTELSYCREFAGNKSATQGVQQRECLFADKHTMNPTGLARESMLVPTRIDTSIQSKGCMPAPDNHYSCDNEWNIKTHSGVVYVADIERSTLMIAHSYGRREIQGDSPPLQGTLQECSSTLGSKKDPRVELPLSQKRSCSQGYFSREIECLNDKCPFLPADPETKDAFLQFERRSASLRSASRRHGVTVGDRLAPDFADVGGVGGRGDVAGGGHHRAALVEDGIYAIPEGDIISIAKLLQVAGVDLDRSLDADGKPLRQTGTIIDIDVVYNNLYPFASTFGDQHVEYQYNIHQLPVAEYKSESISYSPEQNETMRTVENRHGILISVKVSGTFGFFSPMYLLVMLTTALGLLAVATFVTDKLAIHFMQNEKYLDVMIDSTEELNKNPAERQADANLPAADVKASQS